MTRTTVVTVQDVLVGCPGGARQLSGAPSSLCSGPATGPSSGSTSRALPRRILGHFIRPDGHGGELRRAVLRQQRDVGRVAAPADRNPADTRLVVSGVEGIPAVTDVGLEPGVKIHRHIGWLDTNIREIT